MWIVDRVNNAFTHAGQIVYPGDVERCIGEHPAVRDVGVVGVDGSGHAFVVLHDQSTATATEIIEHCTARLDPRAAPASVVFVDSLPRTTVGKLDRPTLVSLHRANTRRTAAARLDERGGRTSHDEERPTNMEYGPIRAARFLE